MILFSLVMKFMKKEIGEDNVRALNEAVLSNNGRTCRLCLLEMQVEMYYIII